MNARRIYMTTQEAIALENLYQIPTYARMPIVLARGEGSYVWDIEGRKYLDLYGGHFVALLGHSPTRVVEAIRKQAWTAPFLFQYRLQRYASPCA